MKSEEFKLTIAEHLEELRRRLGVSLATVLVTTLVSFFQMDRLLRWLQHPVERFVPRFAYFSPTEPFVAYVKVSFLAGLVVAMPVLLWQVWAFVRRGLTSSERRYGMVFIWGASALFVVGVGFAYTVLLPASLSFLLGLGAGHLEPVISIDRYLSFVVTLGFWCGMAFEIPAILWLLAKMGIVTPEWLRQQRPYAILVMVIIAAIVTPTTDAVTLLFMAVPMILLYEVSILLSRWATPTPRRSSFSNSSRSFPTRSRP